MIKIISAGLHLTSRRSFEQVLSWDLWVGKGELSRLDHNLLAGSRIFFSKAWNTTRDNYVEELVEIFSTGSGIWRYLWTKGLEFQLWDAWASTF